MREYHIAMDYNNCESYEMWSTIFDQYILLLGYAFHIDPIKSYKLYKATATQYRVNSLIFYDLEGLECEAFYEKIKHMDDDTTRPYLPLSDLPEVINFIKLEIIPSLMVLPEDQSILSLWSLEGKSTAQYLSDLGGFMNTFISDSENFDSSVGHMLYCYKKLTDNVFDKAIERYRSYDIVIY